MTAFTKNTPTPIEHDPSPPDLTDEQVSGIVSAAEQSHSAATRTAYANAWRHFTRWAAKQGFDSLPAAPETVAAYLVERADRGLSSSTLRIARAAIAHMHRQAGVPDPTAAEGVKRVLRGLNRRLAREHGGQKQATGLTAVGLAAIRASALNRRTGPTGRIEPETTARRRGLTDIALCSVMRDALLRGSEAAALRWRDIELRDDGTARVTIRHSKGDQEGEGATLFVGRDATADLRAIRPKESEPDQRVFGLKSRPSITNRIRAAAKAAGLEGTFTSHSPRVGMATDLVAAGASLAAVQVAGRWKSSRMPATYARGELAGQGAVARFYEE